MSATIKLPLCHYLVRSVILFNNMENIDYKEKYESLVKEYNKLRGDGECEYRDIDMINFAKWFRRLNPDEVDMYDVLSWWKQLYRDLENLVK
jgi:hypothetical protein